MQFDAIAWVTWMWLTIGLYWLVPAAWRLALIVGLTALFLGVHSPISLPILLGCVVTCHVSANMRDPTWQQAALGVGVIVVVLATFKIGRTQDANAVVANVLLPLGISYYSFRAIHFILERYKGHAERVSLRDLFGYLFFLPTLVVGPIHRVDDYLYDLRRQRFDPAMLSEGAERIIYGYVKIMVLSNLLTEGIFGDYIAGYADQTTAWVTYLLIVQNGFNLYFQFSGYSDIAIGFARMLGFKVIENFNWPYLQPNIGAFWRSWHISLSRWCRDYVYGVVVSTTRSPALGALSVMTVIGLWHEISLRFLLWGAYHGLALIVWQRWNDHGPALPVTTPRVVVRMIYAAKVAFTVNFVFFGFVILKADGPLDALRIFARFLPF